MRKKLYPSIDLSCSLQEDNDISAGTCINGIISRTENGFRFEEAIHRRRDAHNPKLYDGKYVSMVRKQNGKYQCHMKNMGDGIEREKFAFSVYSELIDALQIIEQ